MLFPLYRCLILHFQFLFVRPIGAASAEPLHQAMCITKNSVYNSDANKILPCHWLYFTLYVLFGSELNKRIGVTIRGFCDLVIPEVKVMSSA